MPAKVILEASSESFRVVQESETTVTHFPRLTVYANLIIWSELSASDSAISTKTFTRVFSA